MYLKSISYFFDIFALKIRKFNQKLLNRVPKTPLIYDLYTHFNSTMKLNFDNIILISQISWKYLKKMNFWRIFTFLRVITKELKKNNKFEISKKNRLRMYNL